MTLDEARAAIGRNVEYRPSHVSRFDPGEPGVVVSVNDAWVFVRYGHDQTSKATSAGDLALKGSHG